MKRIPLSQGKVAQVSDRDFSALSAYTWFAFKTRSGFYAARNKKPKGSGLVLMHRSIMQTPDSLKTDHKDHDTLNNQRRNLRVCTHAQNLQNRRGPDVRCKSGARGVYFFYGKFRVQIFVRGVVIRLGGYASLEEASLVSEWARRFYYGEFSGRVIEEAL